MDSAGKNRYELLFMDDDVTDPLDNLVAKKKQQTAKTANPTAINAASGHKATRQNQSSVNASAAAVGVGGGKSKPNQAEKENKPGALNKNDAGLKKNQTGDKLNNNNKQGGAAVAAVNRKQQQQIPREGGQGQQQRNVNFRQQNGETREQRNNRRNIRNNENGNVGGSGSGTDGGSNQRQFRGERPPRNRNFDGGRAGGERKREFDRQSGSDKTGVKAIDKRDGAGAHNWGSVKEAIDDVNKNESETGVNATTGGGSGEKISDESGNEQQIEQTPVEEETKELTLDEWKAQQQQRVKPTFNIRKAGEGEDTSQWKKMIVLTNNKKKENESEEELEYDPAMYPQRVGRQQRVLDIQFNFNDGRRGGGGFGGRPRGGPRGGLGGPRQMNGNVGGGDRPLAGERGERRSGGGGGKRNFGGERQQQNAPRVNDERQFPTLS